MIFDTNIVNLINILHVGFDMGLIDKDWTARDKNWQKME